MSLGLVLALAVLLLAIGVFAAVTLSVGGLGLLVWVLEVSGTIDV